VLEQMQHEMWSRFAIPFVRLDSQGVARVKQKLPANRNPFSYLRRVITSRRRRHEGEGQALLSTAFPGGIWLPTRFRRS
jgi:hypothetical protein